MRTVCRSKERAVIDDLSREPLLLDLFNRLRQAGLPLSVDDYLLALQALQFGYALIGADSLRRLCYCLWVKAAEHENDGQTFEAILSDVLRDHRKQLASLAQESSPSFPTPSTSPQH